MKINAYFFQFAILLIIIFGGVFAIRYFRTGELLLDQLIGVLVGVILLITTLFSKKLNNKKETNK